MTAAPKGRFMMSFDFAGYLQAMLARLPGALRLLRGVALFVVVHDCNQYVTLPSLDEEPVDAL